MFGESRVDLHIRGAFNLSGQETESGLKCGQDSNNDLKYTAKITQEHFSGLKLKIHQRDLRTHGELKTIFQEGWTKI